MAAMETWDDERAADCVCFMCVMSNYNKVPGRDPELHRKQKEDHRRRRRRGGDVFETN